METTTEAARDKSLWGKKIQTLLKFNKKQKSIIKLGGGRLQGQLEYDGERIGEDSDDYPSNLLPVLIPVVIVLVVVVGYVR